MSDTDLDAQTRAFFAAWSESFAAMGEAFEATLAERCDWDQRPMARTRSRASALRLLERSRRLLGVETIDVEVLELAVQGDVVHTARIDHLRRADGSLIVSASVAGVMRYEDGQIVEWREYFDLASLAGQALVGSATHFALQLGRRLRRR